MWCVISVTGTSVLVFLLSSISLLFISQPLAYSLWYPRFLLWLEHCVILVLVTGWCFPFWTRRMYISLDSAVLFSCYSLFLCTFVIFTCFNQLTMKTGQKESTRVNMFKVYISLYPYLRKFFCFLVSHFFFSVTA